MCSFLVGFTRTFREASGNSPRPSFQRAGAVPNPTAMKHETSPEKRLAERERLAEIIRRSGLSINAFALRIGLPRGENLYRIRRGANGISRDLAERIHARYPQYSIRWLLSGDEQE